MYTEEEYQWRMGGEITTDVTVMGSYFRFSPTLPSVCMSVILSLPSASIAMVLPPGDSYPPAHCGLGRRSG